MGGFPTFCHHMAISSYKETQNENGCMAWQSCRHGKAPTFSKSSEQLYKVGLYDRYTYHGPPKPTCLEVFMVNNLVFRWPKPLFFMVLGAHGSYKWGDISPL